MNSSHTSRWRRFGATVAALAATAVVIAGCSSGGASTSAAGSALTIANVGGATWTCGFNPFNPAVNQESFGFAYEPLIYVNALKNSAQTPMLAKSAAWSADYKTLTFTIRDGVKWSDGKPFSAADVAFTFNLLKKHPGLDLNAIWSSGLQSVATSGSDQVVFTFSSAAQPYFYYIADQTPIVPEHVWSTGSAGSDPVKFNDPKPVGTGPYTVASCSPQNIKYTANGSYWQPGKPQVKTVDYPSYTDNSPANQDLASGKAQWGGQFIPSIDKYYVAKDKANNHYWFPPTTNVNLAFNLKHDVTGKVEVRQAIAYALNRDDISKVGENGYQPGANQSGIVTPTYDSWVDKDLASQYDYTQNLDKAKSLLASAGYSDSNPLKLSVITVSGYTDWDASLGEIKQQLAKVGVELTVQDLAGQTYDSRLYTGDFDLAYMAETGGPAPYYELRQLLYSGNSAPLGQNAATNYMRFEDPSVDALINSYASASDDEQHSIVSQLQKVMLTEVPVIPTTENVSWYQYNTKSFTGWPTKSDPYALPAPYNVPDNEQVLLGLKPGK
ncbi:ABC transporter substrate-binding protein [Gryllotalpicola protaetiae]|uniref:ABC transporter substrate-binding protein n=1 Tax=Gryllotalpicola protaetiae TaxID=2419771 RepID=A0A387BSL4_9MICO|nr:ABC transporter substrate-binding protein [Gryllotalpicola protaetiae]AYG03927.1 ABC transporter substrate-binding protein [Gryllotalpicola protaetiae]